MAAARLVPEEQPFLPGHGNAPLEPRGGDALVFGEPLGWCLGSEASREELLARVSQPASPRHTGRRYWKSALAKAERIVQEALAHLGWMEADLRGHRKGDGRKVPMAARLRRETTMSLAWIGQCLAMGASGHAPCLLYRRSHETQKSENNFF